MQRYLSIVLGDNCHISHTLISDSNYELDKYICANFKDSEQIREKFTPQINQFLNENKSLIHSIEERTNKMYRGQIVILQCCEDGILKRIKVIYKSDINKIKKELLPNQEFMQKFIYDNRRYFSSFIYNRTRYFQKKTPYDTMMNQFYREIKDDASFFEFCRTILKYAEEYFNNKQNKNDIGESKKVDDINVKTLQMTNVMADNDDETPDPDWEFRPDLDDIELGRYSPDGELIINDIEDIAGEDQEEQPKVKSKVKTYKRDPNQISFFD